MEKHAVADVAGMISEQSRAAILMALMDGRMHPATELAYMAGIKPQTASFHLSKMSNLNLISMEQQGRHRYYMLNPAVAPILEGLLSIAPPVEVRSFKHANQTKSMKEARTCYDHFAGVFGVALTDSLVRNGWIIEEEKDFLLTTEGATFFENFGIDTLQLKKKKRHFSKKCLDWSERRFHLAGALGHSLVVSFHERNWTQPMEGSRAIKITEVGKRGLMEHFDLNIKR